MHLHKYGTSATRYTSCKFANSRLCSSTSSERTAMLSDKCACNVWDDIICCEVPPPNLNSDNVFSHLVWGQTDIFFSQRRPAYETSACTTPMHPLTVQPWPWIFWAVPQGCQCVVVQWFGPTPSGESSCHTADGSLRTGGAPRLWRGERGGRGRGGERGMEGGGEKEKRESEEEEGGGWINDLQGQFLFKRESFD